MLPLTIQKPDLLSSGYFTIAGFFPLALTLRKRFEDHFSQPYTTADNDLQIWDYWFVPGQYTFLRTNPKRILGEQLITSFVRALRNWTFENLGLPIVTYPHLSMYVDSCVQNLHNDSENGRLAYVYSLTPWKTRRFEGGETIIMKELPYWSSDQYKRAGAGSAFYDLIPAEFNQLLIFDDRLIHGVRTLEGSMSPVEGRVVMHGHLREAGLVVSGETKDYEVIDELVRETALTVVRDFQSELSDAHGFATFRVRITATGVAENVEILFNRILTPHQPNRLSGVRIAKTLAERLTATSFPESVSGLTATFPLIVE